MLNLNLYIAAAAAIKPENSGPGSLLRLVAREPDYAGIIPPMQLRRMSKAVRMGIGAARNCLQAAGQEKPDAITIGTSLGCIADTEVFLKKLVEQEEQMLTPTAFIQSTHNTVAGQIALGVGCNGYNNTISQRGHSFEGAIVSAALHLAEHPGTQMLCGGVDELTDTVHGLLQRVGIYAKQPPDKEGRLHTGAVAGEGAGVLLLQTSAVENAPLVLGIEVFTEHFAEKAAQRILQTMAGQGGLRNTDALYIGACGDIHSEAGYAPVEHGIRYRMHTGAWGTDVAPLVAGLASEWPAEKERIWIVTHWGHDWSIWLLGLSKT